MPMNALRSLLLVSLVALPLTACEEESEYRGRSLEAQADSVVQLLQQHDFERLATYVHPERGLTFSPYSYVEPQEAVTLSREEVADVEQDSTMYVWGREDGTGEEIRMTPSTFISERITDRDFTAARRGGRDEVLETGNTMNNLPDAFYDEPPGPDSRQEITFIEYHIPGSGEFGGMDWASLRLVFQREEDTWYLIAVVRDQWTI